MLASIKESGTRHDAHLGALGARWGLQSEASFRNGLRAILEKSFKVKVEPRALKVSEELSTKVYSYPDFIEMEG